MPSPLRPLVVLLAACAAALAATALPARAGAICGEGTYAYAGYAGFSGPATAGVAASIEQAGPLDVRAGHVAGWVGVVDPRADVWLQTGLSALPGDRTSQIYYEVALPGHDPVYRDVHRFVDAGQPHRFAVLELTQRPNWWHVLVDGQPVTAPIHLPGSHGRWIPQVLGESWAGQSSGTCNGYAYAFSGVQLFSAAGSSVAGLGGPVRADADYGVFHRSRTSFVAASPGITGARLPANGR